MENALNDILSSLPNKPGVYRYYNNEGRLLYVGKAKNLKKRVLSYFNKKLDNARLRIMVKQISDIQFTVVKSESDAFLLENNLIKSEKPKYNILLRDDKTYPYIVIKKERFPRVFLTRTKLKDGSSYYGPFTSSFYAKKALEVIFKLFPIRTCKLNLHPDNIAAKKFKVCLEYHIGNCLGPCEALQNEDEYNASIAQVRNILEGKTASVIPYFDEKIAAFSEALEFEKALDYTKRKEALEQYSKKNTIANTGIKHIDVYHILKVDAKYFIQLLKIKNGAIVAARNYELNVKLDEAADEALTYAIRRQHAEYEEEEKPLEVVTPFPIQIEPIPNSSPASGEKKNILDLAFRNLIAQKQHYFDIKQKKDKKPDAQKRIMQTLQKDLSLKELPDHIECFDNSNIQGTNPVASMVCFRNAKPAKKDYRHYKIKTVVGPDDFASMTEVVYRRYKRLLDEKLPLPKLIVIDGGKGQLSAAMESLRRLGIEGKIPIIGIAKRLEEIYFPYDSYPLYINKASEGLKLIQQLRNEAHRFAITFHRNLRSKNFGTSEIETIKGIGKQTSVTLLREFQSVEKIKRASFEELALFIGPAKATIILDYFKS